MGKINSASWKVNTPGLLEEVLVNPQAAILAKPINIFGKLLDRVATRASQLNDPILNDLMCKLALYEIANPYSDRYDAKRIKAIERKAEKVIKQQ